MFVIKINVIQHALIVLDIETKGQQLLSVQGIYYVIKLSYTKYDTDISLLDKPQLKLFIVTIEQLFTFKNVTTLVLLGSVLPLRYISFISLMKRNWIGLQFLHF